MRATTLLAAFAIGLAAACSASPAPTGSSSPAVSGARAATPQPGAQTGSIGGLIQFPSDFIPPLAIYAIATDASRYYTTEIIQNQTHYSMRGLRPGDYNVYATTRPIQVTGASGARTQSPARFGGGYTKSVTCGLDGGGPDPSLINVHVSAGATVEKVEPNDWYVGLDFYPLIPGGGPPALTVPVEEFSYPTAARAAGHFAQVRTGARLVQDQASCPVHVAWGWVGSGA